MMRKAAVPNRTLRYHRERRNWTQEQAAEALLTMCGPGPRGEINARMISRWERGEQLPSLDYREKLCRLYGVSSPEELGFLKREQADAVVERVSQTSFTATLAPPSPRPFVEQQGHIWLTQGACYLGQLLTEGWSSEEILASLQVVLQGIQGIPAITRRELLTLGADAVVSGIPVFTDQRVSEEELLLLHSSLGESINAGFNLFHSSSNAQVLAVGQALLHIVQKNHALLFPRVRSIYYSAVYNLIGLALLFQAQYQNALDMHMNAHIAALSTGDPWNVAQSLMCQAGVYQTLEQHDKALQAIEEALLSLSSQTDTMSLRAKAHLLGCWADSAMTIGEFKTAQQKLEGSIEYLDLNSSNEEFDYSTWLQLAGNMPSSQEIIPPLFSI